MSEAFYHRLAGALTEDSADEDGIVTRVYVNRPRDVEMVPILILDQENRIRVAIDDLVEFLNVMGAD